MPQATSQLRVLGTSLGLFCLSLFITAYSVRNPGIAGAGSALVSQLLSPPQRVIRGLSASVASFWSHYVALIDTAAENDDLKIRLTALETDNFRLREVQQENNRLRDLLKVTEEHKLKGMVAQVIGYDASNWVQGITVDRGETDGLKPGMAVLAGTGLVGQVISVTDSSARVLLLSDHVSGVDVIVQGSRVRGVVGGSGRVDTDLELDCRYVAREDEINVGERLITSGVDGIFPPGILVGVVRSVDKRGNGLFQSVAVEPAVSFRKLEEVLIVTSWQGKSLLEKRAEGSGEQ